MTSLLRQVCFISLSHISRLNCLTKKKKTFIPTHSPFRFATIEACKVNTDGLRMNIQNWVHDCILGPGGELL